MERAGAFPNAAARALQIGLEPGRFAARRADDQPDALADTRRQRGPSGLPTGVVRRDRRVLNNGVSAT